MHFVYVLLSGKDGNLYIGCTSNINSRVRQHNQGLVRATKARRPLKLIYKEEYSDKYEAFRKERFYKSPKGKKELKERMLCRVV